MSPGKHAVIRRSRLTWKSSSRTLQCSDEFAAPLKCGYVLSPEYQRIQATKVKTYLISYGEREAMRSKVQRWVNRRHIGNLVRGGYADPHATRIRLLLPASSSSRAGPRARPRDSRRRLRSFESSINKRRLKQL